MSFSLRPAVRENVSLLIGLAGGTGSGKTYTAMRLAAGIAGDKPFAVIDTEAGRAKHYADKFRFDHGDLSPPFRPDAYANAIAEVDKAGYSVIVVDSMSHVWAGDGGVLDWQEEELNRMAGTDYQKREACKMAAWIKPKMGHKHMVAKLLQIRAHLIICFRAEEKIEMVKQDGKMKIVPKSSPIGLGGWIPITEKNLPFELTASFLLTADAPGLPKPIKLQEQHRHLFDPNTPITEASGKGVADWAAGGKPRLIVATKSDFAAQIAAAGDIAELRKVKIGMANAKSAMAEDEVTKLRQAYEARELALKSAPPTFADIAGMINQAVDTDALDIAVSTIDDAIKDDKQRAELRDIARAKRIELG